MIFNPNSLLFLFAGAAVALAESPTTTSHAPACTATSSTGSGAFFDLRPDLAVLPNSKGSSKYGVTKDYFSKGYDYGKNFTMNICGSVVDPVRDVVGLSAGTWANVSAYYSHHGKVYSIGQQSMNLRSRGRKLVLQYTGGSPCGESARKSQGRIDERDMTLSYASGTGTEKGKQDKPIRRKSTTISFLCDKDPTANQASVSFVGTDPDECAYFFEARSVHACAHAEPHKPGSVGPGSIFGIIFIIAVLVYLLGGIFYNRTVAHARGWRQLPNFSLWAGIWSFICDMFVIATSSCLRRLPSRRGYTYLETSPSRIQQNADAENRLIDQLDEEWDE